MIALARSFVRRSRYNHTGAPEAVKFRHKRNIAQQSCSCLVRTPLPWFCLSAQLRPGSKCRFLHTEPKSLPARVISDLFQFGKRVKDCGDCETFSPTAFRNDTDDSAVGSESMFLNWRLTSGTSNWPQAGTTTACADRGWSWGSFLVTHPPPTSPHRCHGNM